MRNRIPNQGGHVEEEDFGGSAKPDVALFTYLLLTEGCPSFKEHIIVGGDLGMHEERNESEAARAPVFPFKELSRRLFAASYISIFWFSCKLFVSCVDFIKQFGIVYVNFTRRCFIDYEFYD